jgi:hypothetical protein
MVWNDSNYQAVSGIFDSEGKVDGLLRELQQQGISLDLINVIMSDQTRDQYSGSAALSRVSKMPEGASIGGLTGGTLGAIIGGLTMAGTLLVPGVNLLVMGPLVGVIAGGAIGTAAGGLVGALVGTGIPEYEAKAYEKKLEQAGNILVVAHILKDDVSAIKGLFKRHGAHDIEVQNDIPKDVVSSAY